LAGLYIEETFERISKDHIFTSLHIAASAG